MPFGPRYWLFQKAKKRVRVRFTAELSAGTLSGTEDSTGTQSSVYQANYDNSGGPIIRSQAFFTYDTSIIPAGSTIVAGIVRYRTNVLLVGGGAPTKDINIGMMPNSGMGYATATFMNGPITMANNTAYTYTLAAGDYALVGMGAGARTCFTLENASTGVLGDILTIPFRDTGCELELAWDQP